MRLAKKSTPEIFEAALDWCQSHGVLSQMASAKAWVYTGGETKKYGDLLAYCVAAGKPERARALISRLPSIDMKSAREAAKALGKKADGSVADVATSAWESLLFEKILTAKDAHGDPQSPRRARSL
jgi:hypothetical protein